MLEPIPNNPIINAGVLYVNGLQIANPSPAASVQTLLLNAGAARNSTNTDDIILQSNALINGVLVGPNACDVTPLVASTFYAVYVIGDSTQNKPASGLLSLASNSAPFLPVGYDMFRRIGWVLTDGSANILPFWQYGNDQQRTYYYDDSIDVLLHGSATSFTVVDLSNSVPPIATEVIFQVLYTPSTIADQAYFITYGSSLITGEISIYGYGGAVSQRGLMTFPSQINPNTGFPAILYKVQGSSDTLSLLTVGYKDYL